jgi:tRNA 2-thiouridine synthesizing protein A
MTDITTTLDVRGQLCPLPIVRASQAMKQLTAGQTLEVLSTDPGSVPDFAAWSKVTGNELLEHSQDDDVFRFVLRRGGSA